MTDWQKEQIQALCLQGVSYVKIGEQLGISDIKDCETMRRALTDFASFLLRS